MKNLIIRTDKLGDFYISLPYINSIKNKYGNKSVDVILSENIFEHFKEKNFLYNKIYSFPKKNFFKKILFLNKMRKNIYDNIFILDGKDRSIFTILALKGTKKIIMIEKRKVNILIKILSLNKKYKIFINDKISTYKTLFNKLFKLINIELTKNDYKFLDHKSVSSLEFPSRLNINDKNYTLFHFDEKWFSEIYINEYIDIDIKKDEFVNFINNFLKLNKKNIIITTGIIKIKFIEDLKDSVFKKYTENIYEYSYEGFKAILFFNSSIHDLEILSINSENIVTCNGPVTHLGNAYSVNVIDIIEKKLEHWYDRHISNTENYNKLYRKKFNELSLEILNKIK